jgi:MFS family permease
MAVPPSPAAGDRSTQLGRFAIAAAFFVEGLCFAVLVTRVSVLQDKFRLSNGQLTVVLLIVPVIAGVGSVLAGPLAARFGSRGVLRLAQPLVCLAVAAAGFAPTLTGLYAAVAVFGLGIGAVDATMNIQAAAAEERYGHSILTGFYSVWSAAGILGGVWNAAAGKIGLSLGVAFSVAAAAGIVVSVVTARWLFATGRPAATGAAGDGAAAPGGRPPERSAPAAPGSPPVSIAWRPIVLIGIAMCAMYIGDAAVSNFSSTYMDHALHSAKVLTPLAFSAYQATMVLGRAVGDRCVRAFGAANVVRIGGVIAAIGLLGVVVAPSPYLAISAFAVAGLGLCVVPPQSFSATAKLDPTVSGIAISRVNVFNYAGFVLGAGLVGGIAGSAGWRVAFAAPLVLTAVIIVLARGFDPAPARVAGYAATEPLVQE